MPQPSPVLQACNAGSEKQGRDFQSAEANHDLELRGALHITIVWMLSCRLFGFTAKESDKSKADSEKAELEASIDSMFGHSAVHMICWLADLEIEKKEKEREVEELERRLAELRGGSPAHMPGWVCVWQLLIFPKITRSTPTLQVVPEQIHSLHHCHKHHIIDLPQPKLYDGWCWECICLNAAAIKWRAKECRVKWITLNQMISKVNAAWQYLYDSESIAL